jgi:hypothetical protein
METEIYSPRFLYSMFILFYFIFFLLFTLSKPISHSRSREMKFIAIVSPVLCTSGMEIQYIIIDVDGKLREKWLNYLGDCATLLIDRRSDTQAKQPIN